MASSPIRPGTMPRASPVRHGSSGCRRWIVMPSDAPAIKRDRVIADGGADRDRRDVERRAPAGGRADLGASGASPSSRPMTTTGSSPARARSASRSSRAMPDVAVVLVPIGGGGLASGVATAVKSLRPDVRVIGVEPELAADARDSLECGRDRPVAGRARVADDRRRDAYAGARNPNVRAPAAPISTGIVTVTEVEIAAAIRLAAERSRLVVEPSGALSVAAHDVPRGGDRPDPGRWCDRGRGQWRERRSGSATASTSRRRSRPRAETSGAGGTRTPWARAHGPTPSLAAPRVRRQAARRAGVHGWRTRELLHRRGGHCAPGYAPRIASSPRNGEDRGQEDRVAGDPHDPGGQALVVERRHPPRSDERRVVRVEHLGRVQDHEREERVLGHLQ